MSTARLIGQRGSSLTSSGETLEPRNEPVTTKATLRRPAGISTSVPATAATATATMAPVSQPAGRPRSAEDGAADRADGQRDSRAPNAGAGRSPGALPVPAIPRGTSHCRVIQAASRSVASRTWRGVAGEAQAHVARARFAEGRAGRHADIGLVDQAQAEAARVAFAVDREEQVEGAGRLGEARPAGGGQPAADDVAAGVGALDLEAEEVVALVERDASRRAA